MAAAWAAAHRGASLCKTTARGAQRVCQVKLGRGMCLGVWGGRDQGTDEAEEKVARRQVRRPELLRKAKSRLRQFEP